MLTRSVVALSLVALGGCELDDPTATALDGLIKIEVDSVTMHANGLSRTRVIASLRGDTRSPVQVTFRSDRGEFLSADGATETEAKVTSVAAVASVMLRSSVDVGPAVVSASAGGMAVDTVIDLLREPPAALQMTVDRIVAAADGRTAITFVATLSSGVPEAMVSDGTRIEIAFTDTMTNVVRHDLGRIAFSVDGRGSAQIVSSLHGVLRAVATVPAVPDATDTVYVRFDSIG